MTTEQRTAELRQHRIAGAQAFKDGKPRLPPAEVMSVFMDEVAWLSGWDAAKTVVEYVNRLPEDRP